MDNIDKVSLLKELEFYSCLLEKHTALKKQLKSTTTQQARINQHPSKTKSFQSYNVVKNQFNSATYLNQKYSFKKLSHLGSIDQKKMNELHDQRQNFNSKYSLSKNKVLNKAPVNKFVANSKNLSNNLSVVNTMPISNSKKEPVKVPSIALPTSNSKKDSVKVPCIASNGSEKLTYNTKDFIKEIESLTELLKKKTSSTSHRILKPALKCDNVPHNKQLINTKIQNSAFDSIKLIKTGNAFSKTKGLAELQSKMPVNINYVNRRNIRNSNNKNLLQQNAFRVNKSVYKKNNVKQSLNTNNAVSLRNIKSIDESKNRFQKISRSTSRKVIFSDPTKLSHDLYTSSRTDVYQIKPSSSSTQELIRKLHTPNKIISFAKKVLKISPRIGEMKSPVLLKMKSSNTVKVPKITKLKQSNTRYRKINKHLTPTIKRIQPEHPAHYKSSLKKNKKKVNNKYKVINKTLTPTLNKKTANTLPTSVNKRKTCDTYLEALNDSAVEKLEQNLLAISFELTSPPSSKKNENCKSKVIQPYLAKMSSKVDSKRIPFKKSKSGISKYKIVNSNVSQKFSVRNMQSPRIMIPVKRERAVLVRRLFKSKNVIINKNANPTSYSAKMIKSKYLSFNKRKSSNCQTYMYPAVSQHLRFKGSYLASRLPLKQKIFKTNVSNYHSRLIRNTNYQCQTYKLIYKNRCRQMKGKVKNRYSHSPVVFIRGTRYATNLNGKTLRKLSFKANNSQRSYSKLVMRSPENFKTFPVSTHLASRVLHRSISRILTASSKKKLSRVNTYCMFYNRFGRCNRGVKCTYIHDPSKIAVCTRFLRGTCKIHGCPFSHEIDPGKMAICSFFLVGQCEKKHCPYRHEKLSENAVLCKDFVQGYCCHGKECKKAHILICPKYMQGECDKGSSCAFPHPPQKIKKNDLKEMEEETKPTEVLLEKVLRYFQQGGDSKNESCENNTSNLFVPKQRKLEEQPSFIPLSDSPTVLHK